MVNLVPYFPPSTPPDLSITSGPWADERSAEGDLASFLQNSGMFHVYRQVTGRPLWTRCFQRPKDVRADLVVVPTARLIDAGWTGGAIVFEVKRPGVRIGPGCSQLEDYLNSVWWLPGSGGVAVLSMYGFLFSARKQHGPLASVMAHQHFGTANFGRDGLDCHCGESRVISISNSGELRLGQLDFGVKVGSRS